MTCPSCSTAIRSSNINIHTDVGQCSACGFVFRVSEQLDGGSADGFDLDRPPDGVWIRHGLHQIVIGASTRSPIAYFLVPFMLVWSGGSLGGIYGTQIVRGEFDPLMSLFGIPFLLGAIFFWSITLMAIWGKVEITLDTLGGHVFTGIGTIGRSKRFAWDEVTTVRESGSGRSYPGSQGSIIVLEGKRRISFGLGVKDDRRYYLLRALKSIMANVKGRNRLV